MTRMTYKRSGVDVDQANRFVDLIKPIARATRRSGVVAGIGGFGSVFRIPEGYKKPLLVSSTDGVGTKLKPAKQCGKFHMLGIDLVAMNVNDVLTLGAEPLFFLDYFAVGKLELEFMQEVMRGIGDGCSQAGCALVGGETAEMPGLYRKGDFDLAGFTLGVVEESEVVDGRSVRVGDAIIGLASSGLHSNGFSFVRKTFSPEFIQENADEILRPTRIYVKPVLDLLKKVRVKAMAHITGGGFYDNIPRVLPEGTGALIHAESWKIPTVFQWLKDKSGSHLRELYRTFNMGVGYILVVSPEDSLKTLYRLRKSGVEAWVIGNIVKEPGVSIQ